MNRRETGFRLGVWMLVFAAFGLWMTVSDLKVIRMNSDKSYIYSDGVALILLIFIAAVAIRNLRISSGHGEEHPQKDLSDIWHVYVNAWKQLWGQKWLRWFFGIFLGTRIVGEVIMILLSRDLFSAGVKGKTGLFDVFSNKPDLSILQLLLPDWIISGLVNSLKNFNPIFYISNTPVISLIGSIALLGAAISIYPKLHRLSADSDYARGARLMKITLAPVVILQLIITALSFHGFVQLLNNVGKQSEKSNLLFNNQYLDTIIYMYAPILSAILIYTISAGLFAGLVGSLARTKREEPVSLDSFTKDIIRYMKPSALLYIMFSAISIIFFYAYPLFNHLFGDSVIITWYSGISKALNIILYIFSMFVPFAMVYGMRGMKQGISRGFRVLFANISEVAVFIALGLTFLTLKEVILKIIDFAIPEGPGVLSKSIVTGIVNPAVYVIVMAVMILAVWGLFMRLQGNEGDVDGQEAHVTAAE